MAENISDNKKPEYAVIIGAGPAGLSFAYKLLELTDIIPIIIEEEDKVGGIAKTVFHNGNGIDLGGHRLFSKNKEILDFLNSLLPLQGAPAIDYKILKRNIEISPNGPDPDVEDLVMLKRMRLSRIYYLKKFFDYPISLKPKVILNLGIKKTFLAGVSYIKSIFVKQDEKNLEDFMINRFGRVLYEMFFKNYTKKVWGLYPSEISKEWGEQRIKGLSLSKALLNALFSLFKIKNKNKETSLIDEYFYPKYGCGQVYDILAEKIREKGGIIKLNSKALCFKNDNNKIKSVIVQTKDGREEIQGKYFISSMPIKDLISGFQDVPLDVLDVSSNLPYRDYILVGFYLDKFNLKNDTKIKTINNICPDSWIYLQDDNIQAGRLQIMNNWSPYLVLDFQNKTFISLEYFAQENDEFWSKTDDEIIETAQNDLFKLKITNKENILDKVVIKVKKAYPAYFGSYSKFDKVKNYLDTFNNLYCIGRNGQHKYNNMDHSMLSGIEAVNVILGKLDKEYLWKINTEKEYHEK